MLQLRILYLQKPHYEWNPFVFNNENVISYQLINQVLPQFWSNLKSVYPQGKEDLNNPIDIIVLVIFEEFSLVFKHYLFCYEFFSFWFTLVDDYFVVLS